MIHMCLASNMLNALGGNPELKPQKYPGPLPGDIGPDGKPLKFQLYPFSKMAIEQAMAIEQPEDPHFSVKTLAKTTAPKAVTIGEFYEAWTSSPRPCPELPGRSAQSDSGQPVLCRPTLRHQQLRGCPYD
jgi:hypothetical protein